MGPGRSLREHCEPLVRLWFIDATIVASAGSLGVVTPDWVIEQEAPAPPSR
jgi:hypothetical protein